MKQVIGLVAVLAVALAASGFAVRAPAHAAERSGARVVASPGYGTQYQTFGFTGMGLAPGDFVYPYFISPDGDEFDFHELVVGRDGTFYIQVTPINDFVGASFGTWEAHFDTDSGMSAEVDFTITAYNLDQPSG